jgi:glutamyl-tRNA synthetase
LRLLEAGHAYRSFASASELEAARETAVKTGKPWRRDQASRDLSPDESARRAENEPFAVRFKVPDTGRTRFEDGVYGLQEREYGDIEDFALLRPDGSPLYNLGVVCDDIEMKITQVIRGQDHLSNTHKQVLLYDALGAPPPAFAHVALINAPDRTKLSKRKHGAVVSVTTYRDRGFLPQAFRNFLALLGWSPGDDKELFDSAELIERFSFAGVNRSNAILNFSETNPREWTDRKALFLNQQHMAHMPIAELLPRVEAVLRGAGLWQERWAEGAAERAWFTAAVSLLRVRFITLLDFADAGRAYFAETFDMDPEAVAKNLKEPRLREWFPELARRFQALATFDQATTEVALRAYADEIGVKAGVLINGARTAVTGRSMGPSLFELLECLGRERVVARLQAV